nr:MAG: coat protein [Calystegia pelarspovirus 1]
MAAKDSPVVQSAAARGVPWAVKLLARGWSSLSKQQKLQARACGIGATLPSVISPKVNRVIGGNPTNSMRRGAGTGNALRSMSITKQEFVGSVFADNSVHSLVIDPRCVRSFPQVSGFSMSYNKYRLSNVKLRYSPRVTETECGFISCYVSDSSDEYPASKYQMYNVGKKFETTASKPLLAAIDVDSSIKYLRDNATDDSKVVDCGVIHYLADGRHEGRLGELFLEFTIVLSEPTFSQSATQCVVDGRHTKGPEYAKLSKSGPSFTVTLQACGKFLVVFHGAKIAKSRQIGLGEAEMRSTTSEDRTSSIIEASCSEPGGSVIYEFVSPEATNHRIYISRL